MDISLLQCLEGIFMGINKHEHFENHMEIASPETIGDAEKIDTFSDDVSDDLFDKRLSYLDILECKTSNKTYTIPAVDKKDFDKERKNQNSSTTTSTNTHASTHLVNSLSAEKIENNRDIIFSGTAIENTKFGEGGGRQYFIRDFGKMTVDGRMKKVSEKRLMYNKSLEERNIIVPNITPIEKYDSEALKHINVSESPLTTDEKEEWRELDENTPDEQGLSRVMPDSKSQEKEDFLQPISDQENSKGLFMPDGFSNPRSIDIGEVFYQLRPIDAKYDSPYVTDEKTVTECKNQDGVIDVEKLLQKLQINPDTNFEYNLSKYVYMPIEGSCNRK